MTPLKLMIDRCGLSQREAADFLGVRRDTVAAWCSGKYPPRGAVLEQLRELYRKIERAAGESAIMVNAAPAEAEIELGFAANDHEARTLGWPCVGAQAAMLGLVLARTSRAVRLVPRGSTVATAAAIEAHGR